MLILKVIVEKCEESKWLGVLAVCASFRSYISMHYAVSAKFLCEATTAVTYMYS
jgi:hypothetical protein